MKIVMRDGRVFQGTALQNREGDAGHRVRRRGLHGAEIHRLVVANVRKVEEVELAVKGGTDEELAASLVAEMLRTGLTRRM